MELDRVDILVNGLTSAYESGLDFYLRWKRQLESQNHYRRHQGTSSTAAKDAVSTSLDMSSHRIRATYQVGFALIGPDFSAGDDECRQSLTTCRARLQERVDSLRAMGSVQRHFVNLHDMFLASEAIRISCVTALAEQYRRFATGRAVPQEMPIPRPRSMCRAEDIGLLPAPPPPPPPARPDPVDFDRQTAIWSTNSDLPTFQSEPPSPPLTPKLSPDDEDDDNDTEPSDTNPRQSLRPKNSVFSIFCPEAMALQADPARPIPARGRCACGYKWNVASLSTETSSTTNTTTTTAASSSSASSSKSPYLAARDGFLITKRFLAKSHCDRGDDDTTAPKYACVLCTSTGRTEVYDTAEALRGHINKGHDKWQMLHDRDLCVTGLGGR